MIAEYSDLRFQLETSLAFPLALIFLSFLSQMYSGMFTHCIKPVLSMPQIEKLFGLLGYQVSSSRHEQLRLQSARVSPSSLNDLLCLSCAFFLARCECRLLMTALGNHVGEAQWELSLVRERQKGNSLQVCLPLIWTPVNQLIMVTTHIGAYTICHVIADSNQSEVCRVA